MRSSPRPESNSYDYWSEFYSSFGLSKPSNFARFVDGWFGDTPKFVVDFGCGNLRDSNFWAFRGAEVLAIDQVDNSRFIEPALAKNIQFRQCDLGGGDVLKILDDNRDRISSRFSIAYSRFFLHAMPRYNCDLFLETISNHRSFSCMAFEFRTTEDETEGHIYKNHERYYVDFERIISLCENKFGLKTLYKIKSRGLAPFEGEDPVVGRIIFSSPT